MVEVICDTSFLIPLATRKIKNISTIETDIGNLQFVVPNVVIAELQKLSTIDEKKREILATLDFCKTLKKIPIVGQYADKSILEHVRKHGGIVGTLDKDLKEKAKQFGGSIVSLSNDRVILES